MMPTIFFHVPVGEDVEKRELSFTVGGDAN